jgi:hypothetical protein
MSDCWTTVRATESQYSLGGYSACAYIAVAAAKKLLEVQDVTPQLLDDCVREGVAHAKASGSSSAHAAVYDLLTTSEAAALDLNQTEQFSTPTALVNQLRFKDPRVLGTSTSSPTSSGTAVAYFITKPPEVLLALYFPLGLRSNPRISWVFLDSHPRPNRDLHSSYALLFAKANDMYDALQGREPLVTMPEYGVEYNNCELLTVKLQRRSEEGKKASGVPSLNLSSAVGLGGSKTAMTPRPFSSTTPPMPYEDLDRNRTVSSPGAGWQATTRLPTASSDRTVESPSYTDPPVRRRSNEEEKPHKADATKEISNSNPALTLDEAAILDALRDDLIERTRRNDELKKEKTQLELEIERLERDLSIAELVDSDSLQLPPKGSPTGNANLHPSQQADYRRSLVPPSGTGGAPAASRAGSAPPRKAPEVASCGSCFKNFLKDDMIPFMCCKRFFCDSCVRGRLASWAYDLQSSAMFSRAVTTLKCPGCWRPVDPADFGDVVEATEMTGFQAFLTGGENKPKKYVCNCGQDGQGYEVLGFHYCIGCGIVCKTCGKITGRGAAAVQDHFAPGDCPLFLSSP